MKYSTRLNKILASAFCAWMSVTASAGTYEQVVIFGDSLSDGGTYGSRFTTNPGQTAPEYVATDLGLPTTTWVAGGTNFAQGGQKVNSPSLSTPEGAPQRPISAQVSQYLGATGGAANPNALYLIQGGANDIFQNMQAYATDPTTLQALTYQSGIDFATQVIRLSQSGAKYIVVQNLPNIGVSPAFAGTPFAGSATALSQAYNDVVAGALKQAGVNVVAIDDFALLSEIVIAPNTYGLTNATDKACTNTVPSDSSTFCTPATLVSPDAASTYVFADGVHPTTAAQKILAQYMLNTVNAPIQISLLSSAPLTGGQRRVDSVWTHALKGLNTGERTWHTFADIGRSKTEFDRADYKSNHLLIGADRRIGSAGHTRLGASLGYQQYKGSFGAQSGSFKMTEPTVGVHLSHVFGDRGATLVQASYGRLDASDVNRQVVLGAATRSESADTKGSHFSVSAQGQLTLDSFAKGQYTHGPVGRIAYERVSIDGFSESGASSTAMTFGQQTRKGVLASLGYQVRANYGKIQPYAQMSYEMDKTDAKDISANLKTAYTSFATPAWQGDDGARARLGTNIAVAKHVNVNLDLQRTLGKSPGKETTFNLGVAAQF